MAKNLQVYRKEIMKQVLLFIMAGMMVACNDSAETDTGEVPRDPNEAVPDSLKIVNDSVIVIDSSNQGSQPDTFLNKMN